VAPARLIVVVVFLVVWGLITHGTFAGSGDEPHYLIVAQSLAFDGDLDVANNYAQPDNLIGAGGLRPEAHARPGRGGILRPVHDIGLPLLFAPYVRVAYPLADFAAVHLPQSLLRAAKLNPPLIFRHLISLAMALLTGLLGAQLFFLFARVAESDRQAMLWALFVTLSPPLLSHSFLFFTEIPSALLVAWLVNVMSASDDRKTPWLLVGSAAGLLLLIHVRNIALVSVFLVWAVMRLRARKEPPASWLLFAIGTLVLLTVRTATNYVFWGTWLTSPLAHPDWSLGVADAFVETGTRLASLLVSPDFGLLRFAPVFVLALPGLWVMRTNVTWAPRAIWLLLVSYLGTLLLPYANAYGVAGGWAPASRMIVPVVPLLAMAVFAAARATPARARWVLAVLICVQVAIDLFVWQSPKVLWSGV